MEETSKNEKVDVNVAGGFHKIQQHRKSTDKEKNVNPYSSTTDKIPTSPDDSRKNEVNTNEESPTGSLQCKPKECQPVISYEIKEKVHHMSQNHLADANGVLLAYQSVCHELCKMFCSSNSLQIPPSVDTWKSAVCNSIVEGRHMYDNISVTPPGKYFSFIEFYDQRHSTNEHIKKYAWKSLDIEKFDNDLIVNIGDTDHVQSLSKKLSEILQQESRFASIVIVPPDKAMTICATTNGFLFVDTHIHNDRGSSWHFQLHWIGLTWRTGYIAFVSMIGT